jgi:hypothetical protein
MTSIKKLSVVIMGAAVFTVISAPADAIMLTFGGTPVAGQGQFSNVPGVTTIDFESGAPTSGLAIYSAPGPGPAVVSGSSASSLFRLMTTRDTWQFPYWAMQEEPLQLLSPLLIHLITLDCIGAHLAQITPLVSSTVIHSFNRLVVMLLPASSPSSGAVYANFFAEPGESFNKVVLSDSSIAFESDNHAYKVADSTPVPEPASSLSVFAGVVAGALVKRKQQRKGVDRSDR